MAIETVSGFEEIIGYRAWTLIGDTTSPSSRLTPAFVRLESATQDAESAGVDGVWPTNRWLDARCLNTPAHHEQGLVPVPSCSCGVYSAASWKQLAGLHYGVYGDFADKVIGEVAYAGRVIECSQGWRGERARVKRLWLPHRMWQYVEPLAKTYRVPVGFAVFGQRDTPIVLCPDDEMFELEEVA